MLRNLVRTFHGKEGWSFRERKGSPRTRQGPSLVYARLPEKRHVISFLPQDRHSHEYWRMFALCSACSWHVQLGLDLSLPRFGCCGARVDTHETDICLGSLFPSLFRLDSLRSDDIHALLGRGWGDARDAPAGMVAHTFDPITWETDADTSL